MQKGWCWDFLFLNRELAVLLLPIVAETKNQSNLLQFSMCLAARFVRDAILTFFSLPYFSVSTAVVADTCSCFISATF